MLILGTQLEHATIPRVPKWATGTGSGWSSHNANVFAQVVIDNDSNQAQAHNQGIPNTFSGFNYYEFSSSGGIRFEHAIPMKQIIPNLISGRAAFEFMIALGDAQIPTYF